MHVHNTHSRDIEAPGDVVGALIDELGTPVDRLWPADRWPTTPFELDGPLAVGTRGRQGQIHQVVASYDPGREIMFRFAPGLGLVGTHQLTVHPLGPDRCRLTHVLDCRVAAKLLPLYPVLIRQHDALVEDLFDRAELAATGHVQRPARWPRSVRLANAVELWLTRPGPRLPPEEHTRRPWRIHEIAPDFAVEDVWALRTPGGPGDMPELVAQVVTTDFPENAPAVVRFLWQARWKLGALLGWDRPDAGLNHRTPSLRHRLPRDLRDLPPGLGFEHRFSTLYQLQDEWAAELANRTVHTVMHLGWVPDDNGGYRGQMAVLVKPNGILGKVYMRAIKPFRHALVYPALLRGIERRWRSARSA